MKSPYNHLFLLIKSLSKTEKRYFKKMSELHGKESNNYLLLFDAIAAQDEYNEDELKKLFKGEAFMRQLPVAKNYLYYRILDALESFHKEASAHSSIRRSIYHAELLQKKGLYDQSMKILHKTKEQATQLELFHALIEINSIWEFNAYLEKYDLKNLETLHDEIKQTAALLNEAMTCRNLSLKMANLFNHHYQTRNKKYIEQAEYLVKHPLFSKPESIKSFSGKLRVYEAKFFYWYAKGNLEAACGEGEKAIALCHTHPVHLKNNIKMYMVLLSNLFYLRSEQKKYKQAYECLTKLEEITPQIKNYSQRVKYFYLHDNALMHYLYHTCRVKELAKKLPSLIANFEEHKKELSDYEKIALLTTVSISYYYMGDLKSCIHHINHLRNEYNLSANPEAQSFLNIFYLIAHYDSGHYEILHYLVESFYRFLRKKSRISKVETVMVNLLRKTTSHKSENKAKSKFIIIQKEIEQLPDDDAHHYIFKYFDLNSWLESKITGKSFWEIIKEKSKEYQ